MQIASAWIETLAMLKLVHHSVSVWSVLTQVCDLEYNFTLGDLTWKHIRVGQNYTSTVFEQEIEKDFGYYVYFFMNMGSLGVSRGGSSGSMAKLCFFPQLNK